MLKAEFRLQGPKADFTGILKGFPHAPVHNGRVVIQNDQEMIDAARRILVRYYAAKEVVPGAEDPTPSLVGGKTDRPDLAAAPSARPQPSPEPVSAPSPVDEDRDAAAAGDGGDRTLAQVIRGLDPEDDDHWTRSGLPHVAAVSEEMGVKVTRGEINKALPDFTRDSARADALLG